MVEAHAILEVADGVLHLGVAAMVGLQVQGVALPVGDESVIAVGGEEGQLGAGRGLHPPHDEAHRRGIGLTAEWDVFSLGHVGGSLHPIGNGRPVGLGYRLNDVPHALVLADGDGEADTLIAADGHNGMGVEAAVGPHGELTCGAGVAHPADGYTQEVGHAASGVGSSLAQPRHQHVAGSSSDDEERVITPLTSVVIALCAFLPQSVGLADGGVQIYGQQIIAWSGASGPRLVLQRRVVVALHKPFVMRVCYDSLRA